MTAKNTVNDAFAFDFASVSVEDNEIDSFPYDVPLTAEIKKVSYKDLTPKNSPGTERKIRLVIEQEVHFDGKVGRFDTIVSPNQAYVLKQYLLALEVDADSLSGQALDGDSLHKAMSGKFVALSMQEREWQGRKMRQFKRVTGYGKQEVTEDDVDLPF